MNYLQAWRALGSILRDGGSWSGHERNCCFLNTRSGRFADVSSIVGFDQDSDSRAIALVDWDHDGDLDLWCANRTAPRARYLENKSDTGNGFLSIYLQGTTSNRDAIGARLELETMLEGQASTSMQTLRAGEGYLSQSSKWIHFGLGKSVPSRLRVHWPNGELETFTKLRPNARYRIVEGQQPQELVDSRALQLAEVTLPEPIIESTLRIVPSRRLPMPVLQLLDSEGRAFELASQENQYQLLTIWATWCKPCISELQEIEHHSKELANAGVRWLPMNVDELDSNDTAARQRLAEQLWTQLQISTPLVLATKSAVECLDVMQRILVTKQSPLPVPCNFLVSRSGKLMAVYKGAVTVEQVTRDVVELERISADPRTKAIPFPGLWAMDPFPPDFMAVASELVEVGRSSEALDYLVKHVPTKDFKPPITASQVTDAYFAIGRDLIARRQLDQAELALTQALTVDDTLMQARMALGEVHLLQGKKAAAVQQYRAVLQAVPGQPMTLNNLAWLLATSTDESLRKPAEAVELAQRLCEMTNYREPVSLDTLAVALAATGEFQQAIQRLEKAILFTKQAGRSAERMEARLQLFQAGTPYVED